MTSVSIMRVHKSIQVEGKKIKLITFPLILDFFFFEAPYWFMGLCKFKMRNVLALGERGKGTK